MTATSPSTGRLRGKKNRPNIGNFKKINKWREIAFATSVSAILFLWPFAINFNTASVPAIFAMILVVATFSGVKKESIKSIVYLLLILLSITIAQLAQGVIFENYMRTFFGIVLFSIVSIVACDFIFRVRSNVIIWKMTAIFLIFQIAYQFAELFLFERFSSFRYPHYFFSFNIPSGFFNEPSHFAMSMSPIIFLVTNWPARSAKKIGLTGLSAFATSCVLVPSFTLIVIFLISLSISLVRRRPSVGIGIICVFAWLLFGFMSAATLPDPIQSRIAGIERIFAGNITYRDNLSAIVYWNGFKTALFSVINYPLGVGFSNMEFATMRSDIVIVPWVQNILNQNDGSSVLFKIVAEYGIFGILFLSYYVRIFIYSLIKEDFLISSLLFSVAAYSVRGASYFDGPILMGLGLTFYFAFKGGAKLSLGRRKMLE
jgi:hypothetical protein